jgi:hypothetical protein
MKLKHCTCFDDVCIVHRKIAVIQTYDVNGGWDYIVKCCNCDKQTKRCVRRCDAIREWNKK